MIRALLKKYYFRIFTPSVEVYITPKGARWGNLLYFFLRASIYKGRGKTLFILYTKHMDELLHLFPLLNQFVIYEKEVKFYHLKDNCNSYYQVFNQDFTNKDLDFFIEKYLVKSSIFLSFYTNIPSQNNTITLNIRRGDFYEKDNYKIYGYDQINFIKHIFNNYLMNKSFQKINIISDDMQWCKENFKFLEKYSDEIVFPIFNTNKVIESFCWLTKSESLILSNSTFSFWGAYISNYLQNSENMIYCPIFGSRRIENTDLYQYNPNWSMIRDFDYSN